MGYLFLQIYMKIKIKNKKIQFNGNQWSTINLKTCCSEEILLLKNNLGIYTQMRTAGDFLSCRKAAQ